MRRVLLLLALIAGPAGAAELQPRAIDALVQKAMSSWQLPGVAVAVVQGDRVIVARGFGVRELGKTDPVSADTLFHIASTTKAFATAGMAILVDEKKLQWDDPVRKHLPAFRLADPCADSMVTLRDIVSHRTGLARHDELWDFQPLSRAELLQRIGLVKLDRPFRSAYQYQNIMFTTAGEVVAAASGSSWEDFVRERLFEPLGMTRSRTSDGDADADRASAHRFDHKSGQIAVRRTNNYDVIGSAGSLRSTARDLAQWVRFHLAEGAMDGKRIVSAEALGETKSPQTVIRLEGPAREENPYTNLRAYAMGWNVQDYRGELLVSHGGALNYFRAQVALLPKLKAGVVVLSNIDRGYGAIAIRNQILDLLIGRSDRDWNTHFQAVEKKAIETGEKRRQEREAKRRRDTRPSLDLPAYAGVYESSAYGVVTVEKRNGGLALVWGRLNLPLTHYTFDTFYLTDEEEGVEESVAFRLTNEGEIKSLVFFGEEFVKKQSS
ncbi:MAG TPA: serine hydrolase [Thermoanaerobaculia bacterium]|nr:serine hydrolase [Thermoanaerobaculia bacterium]